MTVNEFREIYKDCRVETSVRHYKPEEVKWSWFRVWRYPTEVAVACTIIKEGVVVSSGMCYMDKDAGGVDFMEMAEDLAIERAINNLITKTEQDEHIIN